MHRLDGPGGKSVVLIVGERMHIIMEDGGSLATNRESERSAEHTIRTDTTQTCVMVPVSYTHLTLPTILLV